MISAKAVKISTSRSVTIVRVPFTLSLSRIDKAHNTFVLNCFADIIFHFIKACIALYAH